MGSAIAGWVLFVIGCIMYIISIWRRIKHLLASKSTREELALGEIKDTVEVIKVLLETFSNFSEEIQFIILGSGCILVGLYLLVNKPF